MGFNLSERYLTALNLLLIAGLAYFAALAVNDAISGRLAGGLRIAPVPAPVAHAPERVSPRSHYDSIVERDVFSPPSEAAPAPAASEDLHLKLLGTSLMTKERPFAIVEDDRNGKQSLYRLGDDIPDAGKLAEVQKDRIVIDRHGQRVAVEIPPNLMPPPPPAPAPEPEAAPRPMIGYPGVRRMGANSFTLDRPTLNNSLQNMAQLFTQIRAMPNFQDGKTKGFKLSEIQPGSIFQQMGLRDGDVLTTVEGQELSDPSQALMLLNTLRDKESIGISVIRGGRPMQLQYDIR